MSMSKYLTEQLVNSIYIYMDWQMLPVNLLAIQSTAVLHFAANILNEHLGF